MPPRTQIAGGYEVTNPAYERWMQRLLGRPSVVRYARRATGSMLSLLESLLRSTIRVEGHTELGGHDQGPVLFVANHFTRFETFILPYIIDKYTGRNVHSLAHYKLFKGRFGDYLRSIGALSTRDPEIKHRIVEELLTGRHDWLIYPEGSMIKNKKTWENGRFQISAPERKGSPHTGSAVMALQALIYKQLYVQAWRNQDAAALDHYQKMFHFSGPRELPRRELRIIPVNITYHPLRPGQNLVYRMARLLFKKLPAGLEEELTIEGNLLLKETDISIYFGKPMSMERYSDLLAPSLRQVVAGEEGRAQVKGLLDALKNRVTRRMMSEIYSRLTINLDHLFCCALRTLRRERIAEEDLHLALYLAARSIQAGGNRRSHHTLGPDLLALASGAPFAPLDSIRSLAHEEGVLGRVDGEYRIDPVALSHSHTFHDIRLKNTIGVIANEVEPLREAVHTVATMVNLPRAQLHARAAALIHREDLAEFEADRATCLDPSTTIDERLGRPLYLPCEGAEVGIVLSHGYLASPGEVRGLAEHLHRLGYAVYCPRLKGHGTTPEQLAAVHWQEWQRSFDRGCAVLRYSCRHVLAGGFSAGGLLALIAAASRPGIAAAFAINPPLGLRSFKSRLVPAVLAWNRALASLHIQRGQLLRVVNEPAHADTNYRSNHLNGLRQLELMMDECQARVGAVTVPTLMVQGDRDPVVDAQATRRLFDAIPSSDKQFAPMAFTRHVIVRGEGCEVVFERVEEFVRKVAGQLSPRHLPERYPTPIPARIPTPLPEHHPTPPPGPLSAS